jgi:hypothetical protein
MNLFESKGLHWITISVVFILLAGCELEKPVTLPTVFASQRKPVMDAICIDQFTTQDVFSNQA